MQAAEIMSTPVRSVRSTDTIRDAAELMLEARVASLPVIDDGRLIGIVSELDILRARAPHDPHGPVRRHVPDPDDPAARVREVMTTDVVVAGVDDDATALARMMARRGVRALPVVDDGRVVGIVSRRDVLRRLERDDHAVAAEIAGRLRALAGREHPWEVSVCDGIATLVGPVTDAREASVLRVLAGTVPGVVGVHIPAAAPTPTGTAS